MVCLGNICRSPMAEGILRSKIENNNSSLFIDSCGTGPWHVGQSPDKRAIAALKQKGIDISDLRGRQFSINDFDDFDEIYVMDQSNYANVVAQAKNKQHVEKVKMILNLTTPGSNQPVPDPYFGANNGFKNVYLLLDNACNEILKIK